jgi:hypothetical protein
MNHKSKWTGGVVQCAADFCRPIFTLYEEKEMRHLCPVTHFLSLALMDGALDCKTINEVESKRIPRGKESYRFRIEPEWREVPILRSVEPDGSISKTRILTYGNLNKMIQGLGERASYPEKLTSYCFRRAVGNTANSKGIKVCIPVDQS